jgi:aminoglycoside phosphotransferase (APT) family kinase protein
VADRIHGDLDDPGDPLATAGSYAAAYGVPARPTWHWTGSTRHGAPRPWATSTANPAIGLLRQSPGALRFAWTAAVVVACPPTIAISTERGSEQLDEFTADSAARTLKRACAKVGIDAGAARLVRLGENAIWRLDQAGLVVRIARSTRRLTTVDKELRVARWLATFDFPAVRVADDLEQPLLLDGRVVSWWRAVPESDQQPSLVDLARILRAWHQLPNPPFVLQALDPLGNVPGRLAHAAGVGRADLAFLAARCVELAERYSDLRFPASPGPIHGDAHRGNLLDNHGRAVVGDFEAVCNGPREWDLVPTAMAVARFGVPAADYRAFAAAYGRDVTEWDGYPVLRAVRELGMTTWLMQLIHEDDEAAAEFAVRVACLREGDLDRPWRPF